MLWAEIWASEGRLAEVPANESRVFAPFLTEGMLTVIDDKGLFVDKCPISLIGVLFTFVVIPRLTNVSKYPMKRVILF